MLPAHSGTEFQFFVYSQQVNLLQKARGHIVAAGNQLSDLLVKEVA